MPHCRGGKLPYPLCTMGATMCTIVRLLQHFGGGCGYGRPVVLVAAEPH